MAVGDGGYLFDDQSQGGPVAPVAMPVRSSVLAPSALGAWAGAAYALPVPVRCRLVSSSVNDTYRLDSAGETCCYLRVARHGWRTRGDLEAELRLVEEIGDRGVPVARPMPRTAGGFLTTFGAPEGNRLVVVFEEAAGENVRDITPAHARAYGRLAARVHAAADAAGGVYPRSHLDPDHLLDGPLAGIRAQMGQLGVRTDELEGIGARVRSRLAGLPRRLPDYGACHGDLHSGNVRFDAAGQPTLFDFDCWGYGWRAYDLAVFLWNSYLERRPKRWRDSRWRAFLRGYEAIRPLPADLHEFLPHFLVARQVWLMGLDCAGSSGWPPQWLDAGWFATMHGLVKGWVEEYPVLREAGAGA
jgi:Ser/Thr protein kinase RdoA (MazF antagonist)